MKKISSIHQAGELHWVGDGFPVRTVFSHDEMAELISPFLLLDHAGPAEFPPADEPAGVGEHPHRGFETVTIVYKGELEHRDSAGNHGTIGTGDVQWMTAGSGVVHEEWHERGFAERGGILEIAQLWVNLPAKDKGTSPQYQEIRSARIPVVNLDGGTVRVIAGEFDGVKGPATTFSPINVWDARLQASQPVEIRIPDGFTTLLVVLQGKVTVNREENVKTADLVIFERSGGEILLEAIEDSTILLLSGEPIEEPVVAYGPFVMTTKDEIRQAILDYQSGKMGRIG